MGTASAKWPGRHRRRGSGRERPGCRRGKKRARYLGPDPRSTWIRLRVWWSGRAFAAGRKAPEIRNPTSDILLSDIRNLTSLVKWWIPRLDGPKAGGIQYMQSLKVVATMRSRRFLIPWLAISFSSLAFFTF